MRISDWSSDVCVRDRSRPPRRYCREPRSLALDAPGARRTLSGRQCGCFRGDAVAELPAPRPLAGDRRQDEKTDARNCGAGKRRNLKPLVGEKGKQGRRKSRKEGANKKRR